MITHALGRATVVLAGLLLHAQQNPVSIDVPTAAHLVLKVKGDGYQIYT